MNTITTPNLKVTPTFHGRVYLDYTPTKEDLVITVQEPKITEGVKSAYINCQVSVKVNPEIADLLHGEENQTIVELERVIGKQIVIYPGPKLHMEEFDIFEIYKE